MEESSKGKLKQLTLLDVIQNNEYIQSCIRFIISGLNTTDVVNISENTILQDVVKAFDKKTDIPLEVPFITFLTVWSGWLCQKEVSADFGSTTLYPDIWTVLLADSGSGKTFTLKHIQGLIDCERIATFGTSASFVRSLANKPRGYLIKDEFAEFLKQLETQPYIQEVKEYLLQIYSNETVVRETKKETVIVEKPIISLLGTTVLDAFVQNVKAIWLFDGFMQRFCLLLSNRPNKNLTDYLIYDVSLGHLKDKITDIQSQVRSKYQIGEAFEKIIRGVFRSDMLDLDNSFIRRIIFRIAKYSLIFHTLIDPKDAVISVDAIMKGVNLGKRHIYDLRIVLDELGMSEVERKAKAVERLKERLGRIPSAREVVQRVYSIKSVAEAYAILRLISE